MRGARGADLGGSGVGLGGWGDIEVCDYSGVGGFDAFLPIPGIEGLYGYQWYVAGLPYPGSQLADRLYNEALEKNAEGVEYLYYSQLMAALAAIEGAGSTDRDDIQEYMRSGNLSFLGAVETVHVGTDGENDWPGMITQTLSGQRVVEPCTLPSTASPTTSRSPSRSSN